MNFIIRCISPYLQRCNADQSKDDGENPEADRDHVFHRADRTARPPPHALLYLCTRQIFTESNPLIKPVYFPCILITAAEAAGTVTVTKPALEASGNLDHFPFQLPLSFISAPPIFTPLMAVISPLGADMKITLACAKGIPELTVTFAARAVAPNSLFSTVR
jgi:hypothetical protein